MEKGLQKICFLAVQPYSLTVGQPGGFENADHFYRFAAERCGFEGVTLPAGPPFIDINQVLTSVSYGDDQQAAMRNLGLSDGIRRFEMHVVGQNVCLHPSRVLRMAHFLAPENFRDLSHLEVEKIAATEMRKIIDASAKMGFRHIAGFCGGRGYPAVQAKWSAWPKFIPEWILAILAAKWEPTLEYAADKNQIITFEFGHPENDLLTGENFVIFCSMLSEKARKAVGINGDGSHFVNVGTNPMPHLLKAQETGCQFTNHYKWGGVRDLFDGSASPYGGWRQWSEASSTFFTIGTVGPEQLVRDFHKFNAELHCTQEDGVDIVYEGECTGIMNPKQAMRVGADNCRALRDGKPLTRLNISVAPLQLEKPESNGDVTLTCGEENIPLDPWGGGPFDTFADCPATPQDLLAINEEESAICRAILERAGFSEAAAF